LETSAARSAAIGVPVAAQLSEQQLTQQDRGPHPPLPGDLVEPPAFGGGHIGCHLAFSVGGGGHASTMP